MFLFSSTNTEQTVGVDIERHRLVSAKMVRRVVEAIGLPDDQLWLDVGFGNGSLLMTAYESSGFSVFGIDLRKQSVDELINIGFPPTTARSVLAEGVGLRPSPP